jgi:hypothetical protein
MKLIRTSFIAGLMVVAFAVGVALALWSPDFRIIPQVMGGLGILAGVVLLTSRNIWVRTTDVPTGLQVDFERRALLHTRITGVTAILIGVSLFIPNPTFRLVVMVCAAVLSIAAALKVPRRFFA